MHEITASSSFFFDCVRLAHLAQATAASVPPRMAKIAADGVEEVALFRIMQRVGAEFMPQDWWWPQLADYRKGGQR